MKDESKGWNIFSGLLSVVGIIFGPAIFAYKEGMWYFDSLWQNIAYAFLVLWGGSALVISLLIFFLSKSRFLSH